MAKRNLSTTYKTPKYFSSLSILAKSLPRPLPLQEDNDDLTPSTASKKHIPEESLSAYRLTIKSNSPKTNNKAMTKSSSLSETPKQKPTQGSPKSIFTYSSAELTKTLPVAQARLQPVNSPKHRLRTQCTGPRPNFGQRAASIPTTPSEFPPVRPATATNFAMSAQGTPKSKTPRQLLSPLGKGTETLASLVTQVKPMPSDNIQAVASHSEDIYREHLYQTFLAIKFVRTLPPADSRQLVAKKVSLARRQGYESKKTIVFDLDETLVHCVEENKSRFADIILPIRFPTGEVIKVKGHIGGSECETLCAGVSP